MADIVFPSHLDDLTAEVLTAAIDARRPGVVVERVEVVTAMRCGEGVASTADRALLDLTHATGTQADLLRQLMLATPHAPWAMYENEVRFSGDLREELGLETPHVYGSEFDRQSGRFGLLMEDLSARQARLPSALDDVELDEVRSILGHLARLHSRFWNSPRFATDLGWVGTPMSGSMADVLTTIGLALIEDQVARHPFKAELIAPLGRSLPELWELLERVQRQHCQAPTTLLHGDTHLGNTYLLPGGHGGPLDWHLMMRGCWAHDVTYRLVTGLAPDVRREHQAELLQGSLTQLAQAGVPDVPSFEDTFLAHRRAALWGLVIGWLSFPPDNYGPEITTSHRPHRGGRRRSRHPRRHRGAGPMTDGLVHDSARGGRSAGDPGPRDLLQLCGRRRRRGALGSPVPSGGSHRLPRRWRPDGIAHGARRLDAQRTFGVHVLVAHHRLAPGPVRRGAHGHRAAARPQQQRRGLGGRARDGRRRRPVQRHLRPRRRSMAVRASRIQRER
jgi:hypothetical protein